MLEALQPFYKTLIHFETVFCQYFRWVIADSCGDMSKPSFCLNSCPLNCVLWSDIVKISCNNNNESRFEMNNYFFICSIYLFAERDNITPEKLLSCLFGQLVEHFIFLFTCCLVLLLLFFSFEDGGVGSYGGVCVLGFFLSQHQQQIYTYFCSFFFPLVLPVLVIFCLTQNLCKFISYSSKLITYSSVHLSIKVTSQ